MRYVLYILLLWPLLLFGAEPNYQRNIFTTNTNPYLEVTGNGSVTSNRNTGRWTINIAGGGDQVWTNDGRFIYWSGQPPVVPSSPTPGPMFFFSTNGSIFIGQNVNQDINANIGDRVYYDLSMTDSNEPSRALFTQTVVDSEDYNYYSYWSFDTTGDEDIGRVLLSMSSKLNNGTHDVIVLDSDPSHLNEGTQFAISHNNSFITKLRPEALDDGTLPYLFDTSLAKTSGNLFELRNLGSPKVTIDFEGNAFMKSLLVDQGIVLVDADGIVVEDTGSRIFINAGIGYISSTGWTSNRVVTTTNQNGDVALKTSDVTDVELSRLSGVTSAIQTQLDGKLSPVATNTLYAQTTTDLNTASNALVNIATNKVRVAPGAGTTITTNYVDGGVTYQVNGSMGISLQTNAFGGTVGSASNLVVGASSNIVLTATNTSSGNGTNSIWVDTAQPITTTASPTFANLAITANQTNTGALNIAGPVTHYGNSTNVGTLRNKAGVTNDANVLNVGAVENQSTLTNTLGVNFAGVHTNWNEFYARSNLTVGANIGQWTAGVGKARSLVPTNATGGARWLSMMPNITRRRWAYGVSAGTGITGVNEPIASTGSPSHATGATNQWPDSTYTTTASANNDVGLSGGGTAIYYPGKNNYAGFVGRISQTSTQRVWIGLTSATLASQNASDALTTASCALIRFSTSAAGSATNWSFQTCDGSACTTTVGTITTVTTNRHVWEIQEDIVNLRWIAYMDGAPIATNNANLPVANMQTLFSVRTLENVAKAIRYEAHCVESDDRLDGVLISNNY